VNNTETTKTAQQFVETMLRSSIEADQLMAERINDRWLREAHQHAAVNGLVAAYALHVLQGIKPDAAEQVAESLDRILTAGDLGGPVYRSAKHLGFDADQWLAEFNERAASRRDHAAAEGVR
jgi:hypothetical protein